MLLIHCPSPLITISLFSLSVSLFLFCKEVHLCHILDSTYKCYHTTFVFFLLTFSISAARPRGPSLLLTVISPNPGLSQDHPLTQDCILLDCHLTLKVGSAPIGVLGLPLPLSFHICEMGLITAPSLQPTAVLLERG